MNRKEVLVLQTAKKHIKSSTELMTSIVLGRGKLEQAISEIFLPSETEGNFRSVTQ